MSIAEIGIKSTCVMSTVQIHIGDRRCTRYVMTIALIHTGDNSEINNSSDSYWRPLSYEVCHNIALIHTVDK